MVLYVLCALCKLKLDFVLKTKFNSNSVFVSIFNKVYCQDKRFNVSGVYILFWCSSLNPSSRSDASTVHIRIPKNLQAFFDLIAQEDWQLHLMSFRIYICSNIIMCSQHPLLKITSLWYTLWVFSKTKNVLYHSCICTECVCYIEYQNYSGLESQQ